MAAQAQNRDSVQIAVGPYVYSVCGKSEGGDPGAADSTCDADGGHMESCRGGQGGPSI
jgi:hypothetical protein